MKVGAEKVAIPSICNIPARSANYWPSKQYKFPLKWNDLINLIKAGGQRRKERTVISSSHEPYKGSWYKAASESLAFEATRRETQWQRVVKLHTGRAVSAYGGVQSCIVGQGRFTVAKQSSGHATLATPFTLRCVKLLASRDRADLTTPMLPALFSLQPRDFLPVQLFLSQRRAEGNWNFRSTPRGPRLSKWSTYNLLEIRY